MNLFINICALVAFLAAVFCLWLFAKWGVGNWSYWFGIPVLAAIFGIGWLMDRSGKFRH